MKKILVVEDEPKLAHVLLEYLQNEGYAAYWLENGNEVIDWVRAHLPHLIVLDLMLPGRNGLDIFQELRGFSDVPVIMATAKVSELDRLLGLQLGADDYLCKPYSPLELLARISNILRRVNLSPAELLSTVGVETDLERMEARLDGELINLTPVEFRLLHYLVNHAGKVFSRNQLLGQVYDDRRIVTERTIDSHIKNLRGKMKKINPDFDSIKSIYSAGYKFDL